MVRKIDMLNKLAAVLVMAVALTGCATPVTPPTQTTASLPDSSTGGVSAGDPNGGLLADDVSAPWSLLDQQAAEESALATMRDYLNRSVAEALWWNNFLRHLTQQQAQGWAWAGVAYKAVPDCVVTGVARFTDGVAEWADGYYGSVEVPTSCGVFTLMVEPSTLSDLFLVEFIVFPESVR